MGIPNRCFGCDYFEGIAKGTNILCNINGKNDIRNGVVGCNNFSPDSSAGCHQCHYALSGPPGPICDKNITSMSNGGHKDGFCHGFAKRNYWDNNETNKKSGCFISTAACDFIGKDDNCYELTSLRLFRDQVLLKSEALSIFVEQYYLIAPDILNLIEQSERKGYIYETIYNDYIQKMATSSLGLSTECKLKIYHNMINWIFDFINTNNSAME